MKKKPYYKVVLVEQFLIYEAAEGGYYYPGQTCKYLKFKTRKEAQKVFYEIANDYGMEIYNKSWAAYIGQHIGEHVICTISKKNYPKPSGKQIYC